MESAERVECHFSDLRPSVEAAGHRFLLEFPTLKPQQAISSRPTPSVCRSASPKPLAHSSKPDVPRRCTPPRAATSLHRLPQTHKGKHCVFDLP